MFESGLNKCNTKREQVCRPAGPAGPQPQGGDGKGAAAGSNGGPAVKEGSFLRNLLHARNSDDAFALTDVEVIAQVKRDVLFFKN